MSGILTAVASVLSNAVSLTYSENPANYTVGVEITPNIPTVTGFTPTSYSIDSGLPDGMGMDTETGIISGTPLTTQDDFSFTITATDGTHSAQCVVHVTVAAGAFTPASLPLKFALESTTLAALPDGADINPWVDPFDGSRSATPAGTAPKKQTFRGLPVCVFSGSERMVSNSFLDSSFDTSFTVIAVCVSSSTSPSNQFYLSNGGLSPLALSCQSEGSPSKPINTWFGKTSTTGAEFSAGQMAAWTYDGAHVTQYRNDVAGTPAALTGNLGMSGTLTIGQTSAGGFAFSGNFASCYLFNGVLTSGQLTSMATYIAAKFAGFSGNNTYLFVGDSQTGTTGGSGSVTYEGVVEASLISNSIQYNYVTTDAASGWQLQDMQAGLASVVFVNPVNTSAHETAIIWGGTNNYTAGDSGATCSALLDSLIVACTAKGITDFLLLHGLKSGNTLANPTHETARQQYNTHIDSLASPTVKVLAIDQIPQLSDPTNLTYFNADQLHLTDAGKTIVGNATYAALVP